MCFRFLFVYLSCLWIVRSFYYNTKVSKSHGMAKLFATFIVKTHTGSTHYFSPRAFSHSASRSSFRKSTSQPAIFRFMAQTALAQVVSQSHECKLAHEREVAGGIARLALRVLVERDVQLPVQVVLDATMRPDGMLAGDGVDCYDAFREVETLDESWDRLDFVAFLRHRLLPRTHPVGCCPRTYHLQRLEA